MSQICEHGYFPQRIGDGPCDVCADLREYRDLKAQMAQLRELGAVIVLVGGDEIVLAPAAIDEHLSNQAERAGLAADEAYYGGDSPGSYGPSDPKGK